MIFFLYTDGACLGNKRDANCPGGYAYAIIDIGKNVIESNHGFETNTTNNRMEMTAVIKGLEAIKNLCSFVEEYPRHELCGVEIISDSKYITDNYTDLLPEWKKNNWRKRGGGEIINLDLWKRINELCDQFAVTKFKWVKGHQDDKFNNLVDTLAQGALRGEQWTRKRRSLEEPIKSQIL